jgi:co-chaperonin GroES (HSP10)
MKNKLKPIGKWVLVATKLGGQKTTEAGIIYTEKVTCKMIWSDVVAVGPDITEDIKVGDKVMWDLTKNAGRGYDGKDLVHQDWIAMVER